MDLVIKALDGQTAGDPHKLNDSFLVESELTLSAEGGVIRYEVVPVPPYKKSYADDGLADYQNAPDIAVFLAYLDGLIAGRVVLSEGWNRYAWIEDLVVDARCRRLGVGRALMDRAIAWASERGLPGIRLETQSNNVPACKFYEVCGFQLGGFDQHLYRGLDKATTEIALFWYLPIRAKGSHV
ncbi:GNAT family N-acetyltransferase [Singulisphaera acidiphila]|uniref:Acetyltransferase n=1 Tax=Singulisphaera acidiphila (strain ATCC BAA-1392 / DSM 18658 / VKM B-2454 / MOB10) TaxID=886293 RepID=L0DNY6_SINAD|nr:GNAT family N-acetyltransferase [Singulisphaera acidiphila]AGA30967.1 acetyltransferase [Singulisphaera acidiphila DSM 18658]